MALNSMPKHDSSLRLVRTAALGHRRFHYQFGAGIRKLVQQRREGKAKVKELAKSD